jgi:hypothetical protein
MLFAIVTIAMFACEALALVLCGFMAIRYRDNLRTLHIRGPKQLWSCLLAVFLGSSTVALLLLWNLAYIKCLDTSDSLVKALGSDRAAFECKPWRFLSRCEKYVIFYVYFTLTAIATVSFQLLVLERYRKIASLFPRWVERYGLKVYVSIYATASVLGYVLGIVELLVSPQTIISRHAIINTLSSLSYAVWVASTGITDAILGWTIVTQLRHGRQDMAQGEASQQQAIGKLGTLQKLFAAIVFFDLGILCLTAIKKTDSKIIQGHAFAWEIAGIEVAATIVHATLTLYFMQMLAGILAYSQPQFDFVVRNPKTPPLEQGGWGIEPKRPGLSVITIPGQAKLSTNEKSLQSPQIQELDCSAFDDIVQEAEDSDKVRRGTVVTFQSTYSNPSTARTSSTAGSSFPLLGERQTPGDEIFMNPMASPPQSFWAYDMRQPVHE